MPISFMAFVLLTDRSKSDEVYGSGDSSTTAPCVAERQANNLKHCCNWAKLCISCAILIKVAGAQTLHDPFVSRSGPLWKLLRRGEKGRIAAVVGLEIDGLARS